MPNYTNKSSGTLTATGSITLPFRQTSNGGVGIQITGITSATVTFEATIDGTNFVSVLARNITTGSTAATTTADGIFAVDSVVGLTQFRARVSTYASGTIVISIIGNAG